MGNEEKLQREVLHCINTYCCRKQPMYGRDMRLAVDTIHVPKQHHFRMSHQCSWLWSGYLCCQLQQVLQPKNLIGLAAFMRGRELSTLVVITLAAAGE